jgi:hypothetical protein
LKTKEGSRDRVCARTKYTCQAPLSHMWRQNASRHITPHQMGAIRCEGAELRASFVLRVCRSHPQRVVPSSSSHQLVLLPRLPLKHSASCPRPCCFVSSSNTGFCCSRAQTTGSVASSPAQALGFLHSALLLCLQLIHGVLLLGKDLS